MLEFIFWWCFFGLVFGIIAGVTMDKMGGDDD